MEKEEKIKEEPKVTVFGHDVGEGNEFNYSEKKDHKFHCDDGGSFTWGMVFIMIGIIFLCNTLNILPWNVWQLMSKIWPVIIIFIGIDIIFKHSWISKILSSLITFALVALILGVVFYKVSPETISWLPGNFTNVLANIASYIK